MVLKTFLTNQIAVFLTALLCNLKEVFSETSSPFPQNARGSIVCVCVYACVSADKITKEA